MTKGVDSPDADVELLHVTRGGLVESRHRGSLVLLDSTGRAEIVIGAVDAPVYPRSALKPLQTVAMLACGLTGSPQTIALASASHHGEPVHVTGARATLATGGLDDTALQCPPDLPSYPPALLDWVRAGGGPAAICHNCSGKHAAMLATCVAAEWDPAGYLDPAHPLQRSIVEHVQRLGGTPITGTSIDGCGAPAHAIPLRALARSFAALTTAAPGSIERLAADAMRAEPLLVSGTGSPVTELCREVPGLLAKNGAEGVWAAALPDGRAFAAKIDDGAARALGPLLATALRFWGCDGPAVRRWAAVPVLGGGRSVGVITAAPSLLERLGLPAR